MSHAKEYVSKIAESLELAGVGDSGWNQRFRSALDKHGLKISAINTIADPRYPRGWAFTAPMPFLTTSDETPAWGDTDCIVYKDSQNA